MAGQNIAPNHAAQLAAQQASLPSAVQMAAQQSIYTAQGRVQESPTIRTAREAAPFVYGIANAFFGDDIVVDVTAASADRAGIAVRVVPSDMDIRLAEIPTHGREYFIPAMLLYECHMRSRYARIKYFLQACALMPTKTPWKIVHIEQHLNTPVPLNDEWTRVSTIVIHLENAGTKLQITEDLATFPSDTLKGRLALLAE